MAQLPIFQDEQAGEEEDEWEEEGEVEDEDEEQLPRHFNHPHASRHAASDSLRPKGPTGGCGEGVERAAGDADVSRTDGEPMSPKKKKKKKYAPIRINLTNCKYEVLRIVQRKLGWREVGDDEDWEVYWTDNSIAIERVMRLGRTQKINHFSGMLELCRKRSMARNLQKMQKAFPEHYNFFPTTFIIPGDQTALENDVRMRGKKQFYILKPDAGCQGKGIRLLQGGKEETLKAALAEMGASGIVAQHYLPAPFLINGFKFDLRIYALVLSCDPLRVFIYKEGLARVCAERYSKPKPSNLSTTFMHLTNYAVNKKHDAFVSAKTAADGDADVENQSKLGLGQLATYITNKGHDWGSVWRSIQSLVVKSLISVQPHLRNNYRSVLPIDDDGLRCFEVLGYDVMLDEALRPWLIECNHSSSFGIDSPLDLSIKEGLITDTLALVNVDPALIAKTKKQERRAAAGRLMETRAAKHRAGESGVGDTSPAAAGAAARSQLRYEDGGVLDALMASRASLAELAGMAEPRMPPESLHLLSMMGLRERSALLGAMGLDMQVVSRELERMARHEELCKLPEAERSARDLSSWVRWLNRYGDRLAVDAAAGATADARRRAMAASNPRFVLRNWLAQRAISRAEGGDPGEVNRLLEILKQPFAEGSVDDIVRAADARVPPSLRGPAAEAPDADADGAQQGGGYDALAPPGAACVRVTCSS